MQCEGPIPEECAKPLMEEEMGMLNLLTEIWNTFASLEKYHPDEETEFRFAVHGLQRMIAMRMMTKVLDGWKRKGVTDERNSCEETQETGEE
jgi:hypothetical protein